MDRREFLTGAVTTAVALGAAGQAKAAASPGSSAPADPRLAKVVETSLDCVQTGNACIRHCVELLGGGDTTLKACMQTVLDMTAVCTSLAEVAGLATAPTPTLRAYVAACAQYCRDCAAACKKHANHHDVCKACMESCDRCADACDALTKAA
jgi:Cys-rich four helix bundle protein (predicted Tat secretion target)